MLENKVRAFTSDEYKAMTLETHSKMLLKNTHNLTENHINTDLLKKKESI